MPLYGRETVLFVREYLNSPATASTCLAVSYTEFSTIIYLRHGLSTSNGLVLPGLKAEFCLF